MDLLRARLVAVANRHLATRFTLGTQLPKRASKNQACSKFPCFHRNGDVRIRLKDLRFYRAQRQNIVHSHSVKIVILCIHSLILKVNFRTGKVNIKITSVTTMSQRKNCGIFFPRSVKEAESYAEGQKSVCSGRSSCSSSDPELVVKESTVEVSVSFRSSV